jgi:hypothetical protein
MIILFRDMTFLFRGMNIMLRIHNTIESVLLIRVRFLLAYWIAVLQIRIPGAVSIWPFCVFV